MTLPHPDLPIVLLRTVGRCRSGTTSRAAPYRSRLPVVLNTSLNLRGEPIVHRLTEAVA